MSIGFSALSAVVAPYVLQNGGFACGSEICSRRMKAEGN